MARDYKREAALETKKRKADRAARNRARRKMGLAVGEKAQVDHKKPLSKGGTNAKSNLRVVSAKTNNKKRDK